jgi:hypothetical protein
LRNHWFAQSAASLTEGYKYEVAAFVAAQAKAWDTQRAVRRSNSVSAATCNTSHQWHWSTDCSAL